MNKQKKLTLIIKIILIVLVLFGGGYFGIKIFLTQDDADITLLLRPIIPVLKPISKITHWRSHWLKILFFTQQTRRIRQLRDPR